MSAPVDQKKVCDLPASIQDIADMMGVAFALKLVHHFGGTEIKFPKYPADDHPVIKALGKTDGIALCNLMVGGLIYVPHMKARKSVRGDVLALEAGGRERREIARLLGVSQRHVRRMANSEPASTNQIDLFNPDNQS